MVKKLISFYKKAFHYVMHDIWNVDIRHQKKRDAFLIQQLKIFIITLRRFYEDEVPIHTAALTYYTTMAIVPIVATVFAISKSFGFSEQLDHIIENSFPEQDALIDQVTTFAENALNSIQGGWLGAFGVLFLLWSVVKVLNYIEKAFNHVWQVNRSRSWARKFTDYLSVLLLAPFIFVFSMSLSLTVRYKVNLWFADIPVLEQAGYLIGTLLPFILVYMMLTILYVIIPNSKVRVKSAFLGALFAGTAFQLIQNLYFYTQISVSKYSAIYGAFAALPLLIIWINISWKIVMFGAELSFAYQNVERYHYEMIAGHISSSQRKLAALLVMQEIARSFVANKPPETIVTISERLDIPYRLVSNTIDDLINCRFISEVIVNKKGRENAYQPALDVHKITISMVWNRIEDMGHTPISEKDKKEMKEFTRIMCEHAQIFENSPNNMLLIDM